MYDVLLPKLVLGKVTMSTDGFRQSEWKKESETVPGKVTKVIITGTDSSSHRKSGCKFMFVGMKKISK